MKPRPAPEFWTRPGLAAHLLQPVAWAYAAAGEARRALAHPQRAPVPVVCVGNVVAGGAGKTPIVLSLARRLAAARPHILSRGYGGSAAGPLRVDPARHDASAVGDEALLLAAAAPTWVGRDRVAAARAAAAAGAGLVIMDDGFQNPGLVQDLALVVVDGAYGFGNGRIIPAGPLREPVAAALARADAVVILGPDEAGITARLGTTPVLHADLVPVAGTALGDAVVAFAGIGRPEKFFRTIAALGCRLAARHAFPDHHVYDEATLARLAAAAAAAGAQLVTTAKDAARLPAAWRTRVIVLEVEVTWRDEAVLAALLARVAPAERRP